MKILRIFELTQGQIKSIKCREQKVKLKVDNIISIYNFLTRKRPAFNYFH